MVARFPALCASLEKRSDDAILAIVGYVLLATSTIHFTSNGRNHASMWPADALILALLLKNQRRYWPAIVIAGWAGNLIANMVTRGWTPGLIGYGAINMAQTCLAAWLICRSGKVGNLLADIPGTARFVLHAGFIAPACGAIVGSALTALNYGEPMGPSFMRWYVSNALGLMVVTPFLMAILNGSYVRSFRGRTVACRFEAVALHALHVGLTFAVFAQNSLPLLFLPFTTLLILSFRLGQLSTILGVVTVALIGAGLTLAGYDPLPPIVASADVKEFFFQFYIAVLLATTLPVAAALSSRTEMRERLGEREEALRLMALHAPQGILSFDAAGICRRADGPLATFLGIEPEAMIGRSLDAVALKARDLVNELLARPADGDAPPVTFEFSPLLRPDLTLEASLGVLRHSAGPTGIVVTLRNVSRPRFHEPLAAPIQQADELTGLVNRPGFHQHLRAALGDQHHPVTLALVDIDSFRLINERHGQVAGDTVLVEIARRIKIATRAEDVVARLGGDEFAILLRCDLATAQKVCQRMVDAIRDGPIFSDGVLSILTSVSCGIAEHRPGASRDELFDAADAALYEVKRSGRNGGRAVA